MSKDQLDKLLLGFASKTADETGLETMESNVWRKVRINGFNSRPSFGETVINALNTPKFQISSLGIALFAGIVISPFFSDKLLTKDELFKQEFNMKIFTVDTPYLTANLIDKTK